MPCAKSFPFQILSNLEFLRIDDCFREPCFNQGRCQALTNGFVCQCKPGYQGKGLFFLENSCSPNITEQKKHAH